MSQYQKLKQQYCKTDKSECYMLTKYNKNIFFVPTKAAPNPIKCDYQRQLTSFLLKHKLNKLKAKCNKFAFAVSGRVWNDKLNKMASYRNPINHHNKK